MLVWCLAPDPEAIPEMLEICMRWLVSRSDQMKWMDQETMTANAQRRK